MIAMMTRRAFRSERDDDVGPIPAQKIDDLADEQILIDFAQGAVGMPGRRERPDAEYARGRGELGPPHCSQFGARSDGDARASPGIPVRRTEQIDPIPSRRKLRERTPRRERLVVGMGEDAGEPMHLSRG